MPKRSADRASRRTRSEEEYEEEESEVEEPEEERPSRRNRRSRSEESDEKPRSARRRPRSRDEDEDDKPSRRGRREYDEDEGEEDDDDEPRKAIKGGWGRASAVKANTSDFPNELKLKDYDEDGVLLAFLDRDGEPFSAYAQHWLQKEGKRSYVCPVGTFPDDPDVECPICDNISGKDGQARDYVAFNVVVMDPSGPQLMVLNASGRLQGELVSAQKGKYGPLDVGYWNLKQSGKAPHTTYTMVPVKERDLDEDWGVSPLDDDDLDRLEKKMWTGDDFPYQSSYKELQRVVDDLLG